MPKEYKEKILTTLQKARCIDFKGMNTLEVHAAMEHRENLCFAIGDYTLTTDPHLFDGLNWILVSDTTLLTTLTTEQASFFSEMFRCVHCEDEAYCMNSHVCIQQINENLLTLNVYRSQCLKEYAERYSLNIIAQIDFQYPKEISPCTMPK